MTHDPKHIAALADVISQSVGEYVMPGGDLRLAAAAVLDLVRPKPLVWQRGGNHWAGGFGYVIRKIGAVSGRYYLTRRNAFGQEFDTLEAAKAAAEAHHVAAFWAMSGIGGE